MRVVGLMSGTSLDGIDAAVVEIGGGPGSAAPADPEADGPAAATFKTPDGDSIHWRVLAFQTVAYDERQRAAIHDAILGGTSEELARLHASLGQWLADAALTACDAAGVDPSQVDLIGSHGQTVWHAPGARPHGFTFQLGDPATIAERTGAPVVSDFRSRDVAAGGQGAPLVPWVDRLLFEAGTARTLLNIGGMANVTRVPARGSEEPVVAFDTGPGNAVIDGAMVLATDGARRYDANGEWALRGRVDERLVEEILAEPYFRRPPPKSTGREQFGLPYVEGMAAARSPSDGADWAALVASLTAVVARSVATGIRRWAAPGEGGEVVVTGGGAENPVLMDWIRQALDPVPVRHGRVLGIDPAAKEAIAFAFLAWAHATGKAANVPEVTGAAGPRVLGSLTPGTGAGAPAR